MGRPRGFDEAEVVARAAGLFCRRGYEATSIDELVAVSGLHRGSLYKAFGSKRGIFLAALHRLVEDDLPRTVAADCPDLINADTLDLLLVAALELGAGDDEVRELVERACALLAGPILSPDPPEPAGVLGRRLLHRAGVRPIPSR